MIPNRLRTRLPALSLAWTVLACAGMAGAEPAIRNVLVESFGSTACADCPDVRAALSALEVDLGVAALEYHVAGPLSNADSAARSAYYDAPALPTSVFDGRTSISGGGNVEPGYRSLVVTLADGGSPLIIEATYNFSGGTAAGTLNVEIQVARGETVPSPEDYRVRAVLFESAVTESGGPRGESSWPRVARRVLPDVTLAAGAPDEIQFFRLLIDLDPAWDPLRLGAIVFVQRDTDRLILQATTAEDAGGLQPVPVSGLDESRVNLLQNIPNPTSIETRILFTLPRPQYTTVRILDIRGALVRTITKGPRPRGIHTVYWDGTDWRGRRAANGTYLYLLETEDAVLSKKLTLLR